MLRLGSSSAHTLRIVIDSASSSSSVVVPPNSTSEKQSIFFTSSSAPTASSGSSPLPGSAPSGGHDGSPVAAGNRESLSSSYSSATTIGTSTAVTAPPLLSRQSSSGRRIRANGSGQPQLSTSVSSSSSSRSSDARSRDDSLLKSVQLEIPDVDPAEYASISFSNAETDIPMKSREQRVVFLTGKVILSLQKPLSNATELTLNTSGSSFVDVTHFNSIDSDTTFRPVSSTLLKNDAILWRRSELDAKDFPVGDHEWSFVLPLQSNLPPSIELRYGKIEYTIRARMSRKGLAPDVVSPILPINVVRTRPKGFPMREVVLKDPEGLFRMRLTLPAESFVGDESIAMSTELTPIHHDALGVLRSVKIFVREKQSFSCGFKDKNTMFKMETALGKGAKYSVDPSQRNITESLSPHGRHAEVNFPLAVPQTLRALPYKFNAQVPITNARPTVRSKDLRLTHQIVFRLDMDPAIYDGPSIFFEIPLAVVTPSTRRRSSWIEGLPLRLRMTSDQLALLTASLPRSATPPLLSATSDGSKSPGYVTPRPGSAGRKSSSPRPVVPRRPSSDQRNLPISILEADEDTLGDEDFDSLADRANTAPVERVHPDMAVTQLDESEPPSVAVEPSTSSRDRQGSGSSLDKWEVPVPQPSSRSFPQDSAVGSWRVPSTNTASPLDRSKYPNTFFFAPPASPSSVVEKSTSSALFAPVTVEVDRGAVKSAISISLSSSANPKFTSQSTEAGLTPISTPSRTSFQQSSSSDVPPSPTQPATAVSPRTPLSPSSPLSPTVVFNSGQMMMRSTGLGSGVSRATISTQRVPWALSDPSGTIPPPSPTSVAPYNSVAALVLHRRMSSSPAAANSGSSVPPVSSPSPIPIVQQRPGTERNRERSPSPTSVSLESANSTTDGAGLSATATPIVSPHSSGASTPSSSMFSKMQQHLSAQRLRGAHSPTPAGTFSGSRSTSSRSAPGRSSPSNPATVASTLVRPHVEGRSSMDSNPLFAHKRSQSIAYSSARQGRRGSNPSPAPRVANAGSGVLVVTSRKHSPAAVSEEVNRITPPPLPATASATDSGSRPTWTATPTVSPAVLAAGNQNPPAVAEQTTENSGASRGRFVQQGRSSPLKAGSSSSRSRSRQRDYASTTGLQDGVPTVPVPPIPVFSGRSDGSSVRRPNPPQVSGLSQKKREEDEDEWALVDGVYELV